MWLVRFGFEKNGMEGGEVWHRAPSVECPVEIDGDRQAKWRAW